MDTISPTPTTPPPVAPQKNNTLIFVLIGIIILLVGLGGGYLFKSQMSSQTATITPPAQNQTVPTTQPTSTPIQTKAIWATYTSTKLTGVAFNPYSIQYPETWTPDHKAAALTDTFTLTKGNAEIKIYQAPMGGGGCVFTGDMPQGPMQDLRTTNYVEIATASEAVLRRFLSTNPNNGSKIVYDFCGSNNGTDWATPTSFGIITYTSSTSFQDADLSEMDSILKTLQVAK